jgi:aerobic carbon-monoxide dehydrogenase large subunit
MTGEAAHAQHAGAGRPEVIFVIERLIGLACREPGFDQVAIRRRNLARSDKFPYRNAFGMLYDGGAHHQTMDWQTTTPTS